MEDKEKKDQINERMQDIYKLYGENENVNSMTYYQDLTLIEAQESMGLAEQDVYVTEWTDNQQRLHRDIYTYVWNRETNAPERMLIATTNENGVIQFTDKYLAVLEEIDQTMQKQEDGFAQIARTHSGRSALMLPDELETEDIHKTKAELEEEKELELDQEEPKEIAQEEPQQSKEEEDLTQIAELTGEDIGSISACSQIDPNKRVTEYDTLGQLTGIGDKYAKIYVIYANSDTKQNGRFAFVGIDRSGKASYVDELQTRGTTTTDKNIFAMNRDGSVIEKKQVTEMFTTRDQNKMISVTIGQYGILDVDYIRRDPVDNQFISSPIETQHHRPTSSEVRKIMDDRNTNRERLDTMTDQVAHQTEEYGSNRTNITQIDNNPNTTKYDIDDTIDMSEHGKEDTTIRKEAERLNMSPAEYVTKLQTIEGDCTADKIETMSEKYGPEEEIEESTSEKVSEIIAETGAAAGFVAGVAAGMKANSKVIGSIQPRLTTVEEGENDDLYDVTDPLPEMPKAPEGVDFDDPEERRAASREDRGERPTPEEIAERAAEMARRMGIGGSNS